MAAFRDGRLDIAAYRDWLSTHEAARARERRLLYTPLTGVNGGRSGAT